MVSSTEGWAGGQSAGNVGIILHYTVTGGVGAWATFPAPSTPSPIPSLNSVFMLSPTDGWAVGDDATILHYTVSGGIGTWNLITVSGTPGLSPAANLTNVFMLSPTSGWAVGGIQASGSYAAGPVIIYWDGTKWSPVPTPAIPAGLSPTGHTAATLKSVYCTGPNDCWAAGQPGKLFATLLHWDGVAWNHVITSPALMGEEPPILSSVYMISPSSGWVVGSSPRFLTISSGGALSTILRFAAFGGIATVTSTSTVLSTVSTSTTAVTTTVSTSSVFTPTNLTITVKVIDTQGNPVSGVTVAIPALGLQGVTNSQGMVTFTLQSGTYTVALSKGAAQWALTINPTSNGQTFTTTVPGPTGGGIPGFPMESILAGLAFGLVSLIVLRRRRTRKRNL